MAKVSVRSVDEAAATAPLPGVSLRDGEVFGIYPAQADPILLHRICLAAGGSIAIGDAGAGQAYYVRSGAVTVFGQLVGAGGSIVVEHGAAADLLASGPSELFCFAIGDANAQAVTRPGGRVHVLPPAQVPRCVDFDGAGQYGGALYADAACPTCEIWLHETIVHAGVEVELHSHSEDEIILVIEGEIILGQRAFGPGTAVAVARKTLYGFHAGREGLAFLNFRPRSPVYEPRDRSRPPVDERQYYLDRMPAPAPLTFHSPASP